MEGYDSVGGCIIVLKKNFEKHEFIAGEFFKQNFQSPFRISKKPNQNLGKPL